MEPKCCYPGCDRAPTYTYPEGPAFPPVYDTTCSQHDGAPAPAPACETVLDEAARIVGGPRQAHYGHPFANHRRTAAYWNEYLGLDPESPDAIDGHDVCQMNALQKISRESGPGRKRRRQRDTLVDQCGYARNAEMVDDRARELGLDAEAA